MKGIDNNRSEAQTLPGIVGKTGFFCLFVFSDYQFVCYLHNCVQLFATAWTVAHQSPRAMESSRQEYWSGNPFPSLRDLPDPGIKFRFPALQADSLPYEPLGNPQFIHL